MGATVEPNFLRNAFRDLFSIFDNIAAILLGGIYKVFFLVANSEILSGDVIKVFYSRIQLVLGIFMIFKLSMTVLNVIINPDIMKDQKQGASKIVVRVVISLFLLTLIIPMEIPNAEENSLNQYINDHGVLFGFLYKTQRIVMEQNILAKLILGVSSDTNSIDESGDVNNLTDIGNSMASTVLKVFMRINVKDENQPICDNKDKEDPCPNVVCPEEVNASHYADENVEPGYLLEKITYECETDSGQSRYAFTYVPIIGAAVLIIMSLIILGFTLDVAVRSVKLMVLRLIAPIPIISYVDPKNEQKGAFGNWVKTLTSTYVDLFVRLALIYFGLFVIQSLIIRGLDVFTLDVSDTSFMIKGFAIVFLILGVLIFIRQAPKFIRDVLGLQGPPMSNVGLSSVLGGTAAFLGGAGLAGAAAAALDNYQAGSEAAAQGKSTGLGWGAGRDLAMQLRTGDPKAKGGVMNRMRDRAARSSQVNFARRYGVTASGLDIAKNNMYAAQGEAAAAKDLYQRFVDGHSSKAELNAWASRQGGTYNSDNNTFTDSSGHVSNIREALYDNQAKAEQNAGKVQKNYEDAKKFAESHRINPSFEEEHRPSYFGERRMNRAERPDMYNARGRGRTAHQTIGDRFRGSHEDWADPTSPRTENRWNPNGTRQNIDNSTTHDNPDKTIDSV